MVSAPQANVLAAAKILSARTRRPAMGQLVAKCAAALEREGFVIPVLTAAAVAREVINAEIRTSPRNRFWLLLFHMLLFESYRHRPRLMRMLRG